VALLGPTDWHTKTWRHWGFGVWIQILCLSGLFAFSKTAASGQELRAPEPQVKAAFLYNFTKLVTWPTNAFPNATSPIVIGILGKDPFGPILDSLLKDKIVNGRPVIAVRFKSVDEIKLCHVLFISDSERRRLGRIMNELRTRPILTVSDLPEFADHGLVTLVKADGTINLRINLEAANRTGLGLSSRLLRLDKNLKPAPSGTTNQPPQSLKSTE
jgi:hypothetical protein